jgi:hypothetical protein
VREAASGKQESCKLFAVRCSLLAARCSYTQLMIGLFFTKKFKRNGRKECAKNRKGSPLLISSFPAYWSSGACI